MRERTTQRTRHDARLLGAVGCGCWLLKLLVAARLPLFVDEAFYWQEGRHLAAAYSDLPGLTAWLARLGVALGGEHVSALRSPFLLIGAALCRWLVVRIAAREFGATARLAGGLLRRCCCRWPARSACWRCPTRRWRWRRCCASTPARACCARSSAAAALELAAGPGDRRAEPLPLHRRDRRRLGRVAAAAATGAACCATCACGSRSRSAPRRGRRWWRGTSTTPTPACASSWSIAIRGRSMPTALWFLVDPGAAGHAAAVRRDGACAGAARPWQRAMTAVALLRAARCAAWCWASSRWASSPTPSGSVSTGRLPGYLALLPLVPAVLAHVAARVARARRGCWRRSGWSRSWATTSPCPMPDGARAQRGGRSGIRPISPAGTPLADAVRERAGEDAAGHAHGRRQLQDRRRTRLRARRSATSRCSTIRSTTSTGARRSCGCGGCSTTAARDWGDAPVLLVVGATRSAVPRPARSATTRCARWSARCRRRSVLNIDHGRQRFLLFALRRASARAAPARRRRWRGSMRRSAARASARAFDVRGLGVQGRRRAWRASKSLLDGEVVGAGATTGASTPACSGYWHDLHRSAASARRLRCAGRPARARRRAGPALARACACMGATAASRTGPSSRSRSRD